MTRRAYQSAILRDIQAGRPAAGSPAGARPREDVHSIMRGDRYQIVLDLTPAAP